jgi:hypothetical protein
MRMDSRACSAPRNPANCPACRSRWSEPAGAAHLRRKIVLAVGVAQRPLDRLVAAGEQAIQSEPQPTGDGEGIADALAVTKIGGNQCLGVAAGKSSGLPILHFVSE